MVIRINELNEYHSRYALSKPKGGVGTRRKEGAMQEGSEDPAAENP
jgi:hypothetical protein